VKPLADRSAPTAQDAILATYETVGNFLATPQAADQDRLDYLIAPDPKHQEAKSPFHTGLETITGISNPKRALASFRKFLVEELKFSAKESDLFFASRMDRMPPLKRGRPPFEPEWWDFGGFLINELPTFNALFRQWKGRKRYQNLAKGKKKLLDHPNLPKVVPKTPRDAPKRARSAPEKVRAAIA
jgi:hypothetical protein